MLPFLCSFGESCPFMGLFSLISPTSCDFPKLPHTAHLFLFPSLNLLPLLYHLHVDWVRHLVCLSPLPTQRPQQLILMSSPFSSLQSWCSCRAQSAQRNDSRLKETNQPTTQTYTLKYIQGFFSYHIILKACALTSVVQEQCYTLKWWKRLLVLLILYCSVAMVHYRWASK